MWGPRTLNADDDDDDDSFQTLLIHIQLDVVGLCCQGVMHVERGLGGRLLDKPKSILFQYGSSNLCLSIEDIAPGWRNKMAVHSQVRSASDRSLN